MYTRVGWDFKNWEKSKWALGVIIHMGPCVHTKNFRPLGGVLADRNAFKDFDVCYIRPFFQNCPRELKFLWRSFLTSLWKNMLKYIILNKWFRKNTTFDILLNQGEIQIWIFFRITCSKWFFFQHILSKGCLKVSP